MGVKLVEGKRRAGLETLTQYVSLKCVAVLCVWRIYFWLYFFFFHRSVYVYVICMHSTYMNVYLHAD